MLCYYKTYKNYRSAEFFLFFSLFLHGHVRACRPGMHALQVKNKRHNPGFGRFVCSLIYMHQAVPRLLLKNRRAYEIISM